MIKYLSSKYENVPVAILPFKSYGIFQNFAQFKINSADYDSDVNTTLVSASFLFIMMFATWKLMIRKSIFINNPRLVSEYTLGISIPRKMLMK
jgi:phosphatidylserine decarboxylase precursor